MVRLPENFADLVEHWTLLPKEINLLAGKHDGPTKLAFALLLKFYGRYGRFPRGQAELRGEVVDFVAAQVKVPAADLGLYAWDGPTIKRHRAEIRRHFGFRTFTVADYDKLTDWLVRHILDAPVWRWIGLNQANCAITIVQWDSDRPPTLVSFNDTGHL